MTPQLVHVDVTRDGALDIGVQHTEPDPSKGSRSFDPGYLSIVITQSTPSDGLTGDPQPVLALWGLATEPIVRVALRDRLTAPGWRPFLPVGAGS